MNVLIKIGRFMFAFIVLCACIEIASAMDTNVSNNNLSVSVNVVEIQPMNFLYFPLYNDSEDSFMNNGYYELVSDMTDFSGKIMPIPDSTPFFTRSVDDRIFLSPNIPKQEEESSKRIIMDLVRKESLAGITGGEETFLQATGIAIGVGTKSFANEYLLPGDRGGFSLRDRLFLGRIQHPVVYVTERESVIDPLKETTGGSITTEVNIV